MDYERASVLTTEIVAGLRDAIRRHRPSQAEYRAALRFLDEAGRAGELPLLADILLEAVVDEAGATGGDGTHSNVEGPFYVAGAPLLDTAHGVSTMPMRPDEPGQRLTFTGTVRSVTGAAIPDAELDLWQADGEGRYSHIDPTVPEGNLRGRVRCAPDGTFAVRTVVPAAYDIPQYPRISHVLGLLGLGVHRPAHIHCKIRAEGRAEFTTSIYFTDDPWLDRDAAGAAKPSLATELKPDAADPGARTCHFDFLLPGVARRAYDAR